jgi:hypothetical protein
MNLIGNFVRPVLAIIALVTATCSLQAALITYPVEDWAAQTQSVPPTTVSDDSNSPTFTPADQALTVMGTFPNIELKNDGDYLRVTTTLTTATRTGNTGLNALNTALRFGIFDGPDAPVAAGDSPNHGIFIVYGNHNQVNNRVIRYNNTATTNAVFATPGSYPTGTNIIGMPGTNDPDNDSIQGANIGPVLFELKFTRNNDLMDIYGKISGTDSVTGRPYISEYSHIGFDAIANGIGFDFDRAGFFFANNVDAPSATLNNVTVETNVPEPVCSLLAVLAVLGGMASTRRDVRG